MKRLPLHLLAVTCFLLPLVAYAQAAVEAEGQATSIAGILWKTALAVLFGFASWAAKKISDYVGEKAKQSKAWSITQVIWTQAQAFVADAISKLQPEIIKDLEDGHLDAGELKALETHALALLSTSLAGKVGEISAALHLSDSAVGSYLSGMVGSAVRQAVIKLGGPDISPAQAPQAVAQAVANP